MAASEVEDEGPPMIEIDEEELLMMASDPVEEANQAKLERERVRRRAERARIAKAELEEAEAVVELRERTRNAVIAMLAKVRSVEAADVSAPRP